MSYIDTYIQAVSEADQELEIVTDAGACSTYISKNYSRMPVSAPAAIFYPTCSEQVLKIVELANEHKVSLTVRSTSGVESYNGSSLPTAGTECVAVNLSKMNKVMHIDPLNSMAIVEAGVTYGQLNEALRPYGLYMEHPLAARAEKSVLASLVDRDPVLTAKHLWDVPDPLCAVEMVLGKGRLFRSGSAAGPGELQDMLDAGCGINQAQGPVWLDLARAATGSQGTLAIVTWASVKVKKIGSCRTISYVQSDDVDQLTKYASQVIRRRLGEEAVILNKAGMKAVFDLTDEVVAPMPKWTYITTAIGLNYFPEMYMENQLLDMADIAAEYGLALKYELDGVCNKAMMEALDNPSKPGAYWKSKKGTDVFDMFMLNTFDKVSSFTAIAEKSIEKCGLNTEDLIVYVQASQMARNCQIEFVINAAEETADALEKMLGIALLDNKAFFSRPYGKLVGEIYDRYTDQKRYMPLIKEFFDENKIMNPGKLVY